MNERPRIGGLGRSIASDSAAWQTEYGVMKDVSGLVVERNEFRYLPTSVIIRFGGETHSDVTESGRIEMLPFLREQAISLTAHRFGTVQPAIKL